MDTQPSFPKHLKYQNMFHVQHYILPQDRLEQIRVISLKIMTPYQCSTHSHLFNCTLTTATLPFSLFLQTHWYMYSVHWLSLTPPLLQPTSVQTVSEAIASTLHSFPREICQCSMKLVTLSSSADDENTMIFSFLFYFPKVGSCLTSEVNLQPLSSCLQSDN